MTNDITCKDDPDQWAWYGRDFHRKSRCINCGKDHTKQKLSWKERLEQVLILSLFPLFVIGLIVFTKAYWCIWLTSEQCSIYWSHFP